MDKHRKLNNEKFNHSSENLLYNSGGDMMWSLFKFGSGSVTIYYHETDSFHILNASQAKWYSLEEIADNWDPIQNKLLL